MEQDNQQGGPVPDMKENNEVPQNETPSQLSHSFSSALYFLQSYGWFILIGVAVLLYAKNKLEPYFYNWQKRREEQRGYNNYDSDEALRKQEAMDAARQRLQNQFDDQAASFAQKQKEKEEQKRQEKVAEWEKLQAGGGYHSKYRPKEDEAVASTSNVKKDKQKSVYRRTDYNPLAGGGSGATYRPAGRRGTGGG